MRFKFNFCWASIWHRKVLIIDIACRKFESSSWRDRRCWKFCVTVARVCDRFSDFEISGSAWGRVSLSKLDSIMHDWILAWYRYVWFSHKLDRSNFYNQPFCLFHTTYKSFDSHLNCSRLPLFDRFLFDLSDKA